MLLLTVDRVAHGGVCVARADDGRVVFVRHALPGETVRAVVTEERRSYVRADAVEVVEASAHRVPEPCPHAGPGRCGGCDWQHVDLAEQRRLKATVVREQLQRLAHLDRDVVVEPVPGDEAGLGWRTRMRFAVDGEGRLGLHRHRSHQIEPISTCLIAAPGIGVEDLVSRDWTPDVEVTVDATSTGQRAVAVGRHRETVVERAAGREWAVPVGGFWQVHSGAAESLRRTVGRMTDVRSGEQALDLYSGVGLFAGSLAAAGAHVVAVESDPRAVQAARSNLADLDVSVVSGYVERWLQKTQLTVDVVVLDPPRRGAGRAVVERIVALAPRVVVYVACDPAALARDAATFGDRGYRLDDIVAFDLFPMTAHVECVAAFRPGPSA